MIDIIKKRHEVSVFPEMTRPELFADEMPVNRHLFQTKSLQLILRGVILLFVLLVSRVFANTRRAELVIEKYHQSHFSV